MTRSITIDREPELALFDSVIAGTADDRILLIEAASGVGKTALIREFDHRHPKNIRFAKIDFKGSSTSLADMLSRLCDTLGWDHFPTLTAEVKSITTPSVNVSSNMMLGQNQIEVYLSGRDEQEREMRRTVLTDSFFADLRKLGKTILIFDTFEQCDDVIAKWIAGAFLSRAHRSPHLAVIVAGQRVPEQTIEWECHHHKLKGISHEYWHQYAQSIGATVTLEFIKGCCSLCNGHPMTMKTHIDGMAQPKGLA